MACKYYSTLSTPLICMLLFVVSISQTPVSYAESSSDEVIFQVRYKVYILNGFPDNAKPLEIHCHSNDDDLGHHDLWKDQEFRFEFKIKIMGKTHFVCNFWWDTKSLKDISVFESGVETDTCIQTGNCFWKAAPDGIYFSDHLGDWQKKFDW